MVDNLPKNTSSITIFSKKSVEIKSELCIIDHYLIKIAVKGQALNRVSVIYSVVEKSRRISCHKPVHLAQKDPNR